MDEHSYIRAVHRHLPKSIHVWKVNARFRKGVPDCWYSGHGADLWVEYKWLARTPVRHFTLDLSALQRHWLEQRALEGRSVAVIQGTPQGGCVIVDHAWNLPVEVTQWETHRSIAAWIEQRVSSTPALPAKSCAP